jgi:two-component system, NtrC family, nitrogen regulation response regulator GlnG
LTNSSTELCREHYLCSTTLRSVFSIGCHFHCASSHRPFRYLDLEALVFDAVTHHQGTILSRQSFKEAIAGKPRLAATEPPEERPTALTAWFPQQLPTLKEVEETLLTEALSRADGNQGVAAGCSWASRGKR